MITMGELKDSLLRLPRMNGWPRIYSRRRSSKPTKNLNQLKDESKLSPWIIRIAHNLCQDHFRKTSQTYRKERVLGEKKELLSGPLFPMQLEQH